MAAKPTIAHQAEPNVTPFLDVLLVLLIIFMYLALNQQKIITANLPDPTPPPIGAESPIVLEVRPNSSFAINSQPVSGRDLESRLRAIYAGRPAKTIIVRGANGVIYQDVVSAMDVAKSAGVVAIGVK
jgi:biopolymer transport protein ExbD